MAKANGGSRPARQGRPSPVSGSSWRGSKAPAAERSRQEQRNPRDDHRRRQGAGKGGVQAGGGAKEPRASAPIPGNAAQTQSRQQRRNTKEKPQKSAGENGNLIIGRNPVIEALKNDREIDKLMISGHDGSMIKILGMAKEKAIPVVTVEKAALDRLADGRPHQGVVAFISPYKYAEMRDIFDLARQRSEEPFIVILDNLEDPHNLGAIMRTAECAGAHGIIIPQRHACGLTEVVAKASAGAIEYMPCVKVTNIAQTIDELKGKGLWIAACDMDGQPYYRADLRGRIAVVIGSEGAGISRLVKRKCDFTVSMPMVGKINSLNASNAAAVLLYEVRKQRDGN